MARHRTDQLKDTAAQACWALFILGFFLVLLRLTALLGNWS